MMAISRTAVTQDQAVDTEPEILVLDRQDENQDGQPRWPNS